MQRPVTFAGRSGAVQEGPAPPPPEPPPAAAHEAEPQGLFGAVAARVRDAVRDVAATEPDPLDPFRGLYVSDDAALALAAGIGDDAEVDGRLSEVGAALGLDVLDAAILALCAAPEVGAGFGRLVGYLHDDVTRREMTPRLASRLLACDLTRFAADAALRRSGALTLDDADTAVPVADRPLRVDPRIVGRLLGADLAGGPRAGRLVAVGDAEPDRVAPLAALAAAGGDVPLLAAGPDAADVLAAALGRPVLVHDARDADALASAKVGAALEGAALALELPVAATPEEEGAVAALVSREAATGPLLLTATRREAAAALHDVVVMVVEVPPPGLAERRRLWDARTGGDTEAVAAKFRLSARQIEQAVGVATVAARARGAEAPAAADLELGAREASRTRLGQLAVLLEPRWGWDDLVLPQPQANRLRSIAAYLRHRDLVLGEWGYGHSAPGQGIKVLFAGDPGTGKTMAAQVIAADLGLDVFRVDLATVVSKYIGETERNLERIFAGAEGSNAILFFDEADALFGKRSEVRDAHDRYANIEVSYLLQRMEGYPGAVVLATNYRRNIDEAFLRRLDVAVDFPFPDRDDRARIWRRLLPQAAPIAGDVDPDALAERFELSGGAIRTSSIAAAFAAAADGGRIEMRHLLAAVADEYRKAGRLTLDAEF